MTDYILTCKKCGQKFILTESEYQRIKRKGFNLPNICPKCRSNLPKPIGTILYKVYKNTRMSYYTFEDLKNKTYRNGYPPCVSLAIEKLLLIHKNTGMSYYTFEDFLKRIIDSRRVNNSTPRRMIDLYNTYKNTGMSYYTFESMLSNLF